MKRGLSERELALIRWLLDYAAVGDIAAYRPAALEELEVVGGCTCGCTSIDFSTDTRGCKIIADATARYSDGKEAGLILWARDGAIVSLEVYDCHPGASQRMPEVAHLRPFGDRRHETPE
jgi:hypothetical protein